MAQLQREHRDWILTAVLVVLTFGVYARTLTHDFVNYDDDIYVTANTDVQNGLTWDGVVHAFTRGEIDNWVPLTTISHMLDVQVFGVDQPWGHHLVNLLLHMACAVLLFFSFRRMTGSSWLSWIVALLFAVHPLHVESVAWVAERKDVLSTFFGFLALYAYSSYVEKPSPGRFALVIVWYICSLLSKPMLVTLPFVLLLLDFWPLGRLQINPGRVILEKVPLLVLAIAASAVTLLVQHKSGAVSGLDLLPLQFRMANAAIAYVTYIGNMLWPAKLAVLYPYPEGRSLALAFAATGLLLLITALAFALRKRMPYFIVGWLIYIGTLVPVIGIIQVGEQSHADRYTYIPLVGLFIAIVWSVADFTRPWHRKPQVHVLAGATSAIILALSIAAHVQVKYWENGITLFSRTIAVTGPNGTAENNLGLALGTHGQPEAALPHLNRAIELHHDYVEAYVNLGNALASLNRLPEACEKYRSAIQIDRNSINAHNGLGAALDRQGQHDQAAAEFRETLRIDPTHIGAHKNLGDSLATQGKLDEAIAEYRTVIGLHPPRSRLGELHNSLGAVLASQATNLSARGDLEHAKARYAEALDEFNQALDLNPEIPDLHYNLAVVSASLGKYDAAIGHYNRALALNPNDAVSHHNLASLLAPRKDRIEEARSHYEQALKIDPKYADAHRDLANVLILSNHTPEAIEHFKAYVELRPDDPLVCSNLAWILISVPDAKLRDPNRAVELAEHACVMTHNSEPVFLATLAAAYGENKQFDKAVQSAEAALAIAQSTNQKELAADLQHRLQLYRSGQSGLAK